MYSTYSHYSNFLKDKLFLRWQLMADSELDDYWRDFIKKHPQCDKEMQRAITYLKKEGLNKNTLSETEREELFNRIQKNIRHANRTKHYNLLWTASISAVALALIVIGIGLFYRSSEKITPLENELIIGEWLNNEDIQFITGEKSILFHEDVEVTLDEDGVAEIVQADNKTSKIQIARDQLNSLVIPYGKRSTLTLADGSKVWLNSGSVVEFPAHFNDNKREIRLHSGEMYIEVVRDSLKPFHVQTDHYNVTVYGTKFNISNYSGSPQSVVLVEGSISLQLPDKEELFLSPNDRAFYSENGILSLQSVDATQFISWKDGYFTFNKTPMTEVLQQIGRYYNLSFDFENDVNLRNRTCTGKIFLSENLDNVMTTITLLTSTKYEKRDNQIYITNQLN